MNKFLLLLIGSLASFFLVSCEEVIELKLDKGESQLAVDALVAVDDSSQTIRLTKTRAYFDNANPAEPARGAIVKVVRLRDEKVFDFPENPARPGDYVSTTALSGFQLDSFELHITYDNNRFHSTSYLPRRQQIDSLKQGERPSEFGNEAGTYLDLYSMDPLTSADYPLPDFFWLRYSLNGIRNLRPGNLLVGGDASFNPGVADGLSFIYPVRNSINGNKPFLPGDTMAVELLSIDAENFRFLVEMQTQITNTGLFAQPAANVKGNIENVNKGSSVVALGCFGMCHISRKGIRVKQAN